jgi:hypothetical protein
MKTSNQAILEQFHCPWMIRAVLNVCIFEVGTKEHIPQKCIILFNLFFQIFEKFYMDLINLVKITENDCFFFPAENLDH